MDIPKASDAWYRLGARSEVDETGRCIIEEEEPRVRTSEKLKRRPPGVVMDPPGVKPKPKPGVAGSTKTGTRSLVGIEIDMLAMACALVGFTELVFDDA